MSSAHNRDYDEYTSRLRSMVRLMARTRRITEKRMLNFLIVSAFNNQFQVASKTHNRKAPTAGTVEANESTLNTQSKGDCNGNYSK